METITLMMVTYNRLELTKKTIDGLSESTKQKCNLVIVDNNSTDGTVEYLKGLKLDFVDQLVVVYNKDNKGIAYGRNQCLVEADKLKTKWYSTLDNDVLLPDNWLNQCIDILKENADYGMIGVNFEKDSFPLVIKNGKEFQSKPNGNLGTACTVFSDKFHKMLGFFCMEYGIYGEEDADMGMRARALKLKLGYLKENGVHLGEGEYDVGEYREFKTKSHKDNYQLFLENHRKYARGQKPLFINFKELPSV